MITDWTNCQEKGTEMADEIVDGLVMKADKYISEAVVKIAYKVFLELNQDPKKGDFYYDEEKKELRFKGLQEDYEQIGWHKCCNRHF